MNVEKHTERTMLDLLANRFGGTSQGASIRYVVAEHVRSHAGFDARRTADFMALDLWPSAGLVLHGVEVKVSRSDWLRELKHPAKAEEFKQYCDRWWLAVPDAGMVKREELPDGWGLMVVGRTGLRTSVNAPLLNPKPMPRTFLAAFARAIQKTNHVGMTEMERGQLERSVKYARRDAQRWQDAFERASQELRAIKSGEAS